MPGPDLLRFHLTALLAKGGAELQQLAATVAIEARTVDAPFPEAYTDRTRPGQRTILVHYETSQLFFQAARALACVVPPPGASSDGWEHLEDTALGLADLVWWMRVTGRTTPVKVRIDRRQEEIAEKIAVAATRFVVAHELGHIVCRQLGELAMANRLPPIAPEDRPYREELIADTLGLAYHLRAVPAAGGASAEQAAYAAAELVLRTFDLMERVGVPMSQGHPGPSVRLRYFRQWATSLSMARALRCQPGTIVVFPQIVRLAETLERIVERVLDLIASTAAAPLESHPEDGALSSHLEAELERAVRCQPESMLPIFEMRLKAMGPPLDVARAAARLVCDEAVPFETAHEIYTDEEIRERSRRHQLLVWAVHRLLGPHDRLRFLRTLPAALTQENPWTSIPT